jgi:hypothetical protein
MSESAKPKGNQTVRKCMSCSAFATNDTARCDSCRAKHSKSTLATYHKRREMGLCRYCDLSPVDNGVYCGEHLEIQRERDRQRNGYRRDLRREKRRRALEMYGGVCQECGAGSECRLELHHIDKTGPQERATRNGKNGGGHRLHERLCRDGVDPNIQLLCVSCHIRQHPEKPPPPREYHPQGLHRPGTAVLPCATSPRSAGERLRNWRRSISV